MMPSSPMLGRRSGTNSPQMDRHLDFVKDSVIGELSSRIGKPIPDFNKNKRGKENPRFLLFLAAGHRPQPRYIYVTRYFLILCLCCIIEL